MSGKWNARFLMTMVASLMLAPTIEATSCSPTSVGHKIMNAPVIVLGKVEETKTEGGRFSRQLKMKVQRSWGKAIRPNSYIHIARSPMAIIRQIDTLNSKIKERIYIGRIDKSDEQILHIFGCSIELEGSQENINEVDRIVKMLQEEDANFPIKMAKAKLHIRKHSYKQAVELLNSFSKSNDYEDLERLKLLEEAYAHLGDYANALITANLIQMSTHTLSKDKDDLRYRSAVYMSKAGRYALAWKAYFRGVSSITTEKELDARLALLQKIAKDPDLDTFRKTNFYQEFILKIDKFKKKTSE